MFLPYIWTFLPHLTFIIIHIFDTVILRSLNWFEGKYLSWKCLGHVPAISSGQGYVLKFNIRMNWPTIFCIFCSIVISTCNKKLANHQNRANPSLEFYFESSAKYMLLKFFFPIETPVLTPKYKIKVSVKDLHCKHKKIIAMHISPFFFLVSCWSCKKSFFNVFILQKNWRSQKSNWDDPHNVCSLLQQKMADNFHPWSCSSVKNRWKINQPIFEQVGALKEGIF